MRNIHWLKGAGLAIALALFGTAAIGAGSKEPGDAFKKDYLRPTSVPFPASNPYTQEKAQLGEMLFFEPRLSGSNYISCASCHNPAMSWGDGLPRGIGHGMTVLGRRTPTVLNTAWIEPLMWDGRKESLEDQALGPIGADVEMNQDLENLVPKLSAIREYRTLFNIAFPGEGITTANVAKAIATYERTIVSGTAPFDRWIAGDRGAISESAKRGFEIFNTKAQLRRLPQRLELHRRQLPRHRPAERRYRPRQVRAGRAHEARLQDADLARRGAARAVHA